MLKLGECKWLLKEQLVKVLKPFDLATKVLSKAKSSTISTVQPLLKSIVHNFLNINNSHIPAIKTLKKTLVMEFQSRFFSEIKDDAIFILNISSILDPRYQNIFDTNNETLNTLKHFLKTKINDKEDSIGNSNRSNSCESVFDILFPQDNNSEEGNQQNEIEKYFNKNACPLTWWAENNKRYSNVSRLAKKYLCIPSTSTPSERAFSTAGNIISS